jgi:hypothetical protein
MADLKALEVQLKAIGCNFRFWGRAELKELANILLPNEKVEHCINGQYEGGFALLCATDQRVLLIDKKPMYLTLEDIRFDMISEIDYNHRMLNASVHICTPNKSLKFVAYNHARLRKLFHFTQTRVMDIRHYFTEHVTEQGQQSQGVGSPGTAQMQYELSPQTTAFQATIANNTAPLRSSSGRHLVPPVISAYTRLPIMSRQRRFLGSRAINTPMPSIYK